MTTIVMINIIRVLQLVNDAPCPMKGSTHVKKKVPSFCKHSIRSAITKKGDGVCIFMLPYYVTTQTLGRA